MAGSFQVSEIKQEVLKIAEAKKLLTAEEVRGLVASEMTLIAAGSRLFPLGLSINDMLPFSELPDFARRGVDFYALVRQVQVIDVVLPCAVDSMLVQTNLDFASPLASTAVILENIFRVGEEFVFMHIQSDGNARWLNANRSLREQDFDLRGKLVVLPATRLMRQDPEDKVRMRLQTLQKVEDCKFGYMTKAGPRALTRPAILMKQNAPAKTMMSLTAKGLGGGGGGGGGSDKDKKWFLVIDNLLFYYKDCQALAPRHVWLLDFCHVSLGTMNGSQLCVVVKQAGSYPFRKSKIKPMLLAAHSEAATRAWFAVLARKSAWNERTRVFGVALETLATRTGSNSLVPQFLRHALEIVFRQALHVDSIFSGPITTASLERMKEKIDAGALPEVTDSLELNTLAQLVLVYLGELPEPLITFKHFRLLVAYVKTHPEKPDTDSLQTIMSSLPPTNGAVLAYVLAFFRYWQEESGAGKRVAQILGPLIVRPPEEDFPPALQGTLPNELAVRVAEDLLANFNKLGLPVDAQAFGPFVEKFRVPQRIAPVPVTVYSQDERRELCGVLENVRPVEMYDEPLAPPSSSGSHRKPTQADKEKRLSHSEKSVAHPSPPPPPVSSQPPASSPIATGAPARGTRSVKSDDS
jgi:hypothetical protein